MVYIMIQLFKTILYTSLSNACPTHVHLNTKVYKEKCDKRVHKAFLSHFIFPYIVLYVTS